MASLLLVFICIQLFLQQLPLSSSLVSAIDSQHRLCTWYAVPRFFEFFQFAGEVFQILLLFGYSLVTLYSSQFYLCLHFYRIVIGIHIGSWVAAYFCDAVPVSLLNHHVMILIAIYHPALSQFTVNALVARTKYL